MKLKRILTVVAVMILLTSCTFTGNMASDNFETSSAEINTAVTTIAEDVNETITTILETAPVTNDTVSETTVDTTGTVASVTVENAYSADVQLWAHNFASAVYAELMNNKTAETPTVLVPISTAHEVSVFDVDAMSADIFFLDTNFDGIPELFVGGHGTMGSGRYSVYSADGTTYGNDIFTWSVEDFCTDGSAIYAPTGSNSSPGFTKLVNSLPQIHANGFGFYDGGASDVEVIVADGTVVSVTVSSEEEFKSLFIQYLDVNYAELEPIDTNACVYMRGYLRVPDPDNYTEEDIYNCLAELLAEYEAHVAE